MRQTLLRIVLRRPLEWEVRPDVLLVGAGYVAMLLVLIGALWAAWTWMKRERSWNAVWSAGGPWWVAAAILGLAGPLLPVESVPVFGYGFMLFVGFVVATWTAQRRARWAGWRDDFIWDLAVAGLLAGIAGARLFYVIQYHDRVFRPGMGVAQYLIAVVNLPDGGLVLYGGLISGIAFYLWFCRRRGLDPLATADLLIPSVFLGVAFGRLGCFLNGCCWGAPCSYPWGVRFPAGSVPFRALVYRGLLAPDAQSTMPLHPTQLYSSLNALVLFWLTDRLFRWKVRRGAVFATAITVYPLTRIWLEWLRNDEPGRFGTSLTISQWISLGVLVLGIALNIYLHRDRLRRWVWRVHTDQTGGITLLSVFVILMLATLLVMIVNVIAHVDDRVRMQNAADAACRSAATVIARGLNATAFANHLTADVFAVTAFLREARDRNAEQLVPDILEAWRVAGTRLQQAPYEKFRRLGTAILTKVPLERQAVTAFGELNAVASALSLPVFEYILRDELLPQFQRALFELTPLMAQHVASATAQRYVVNRAGAMWEPERGPVHAVVWQADGVPLVMHDQRDPMGRSLPVVDPEPTGIDWAALPDGAVYLQRATMQRDGLARFYLDRWNFELLRVFQRRGRMSQFFHLWRIATCGQLDRLLHDEYPQRNMVFVLRHAAEGVDVEETLFGLEQSTMASRLNEEQRDAVLHLLGTQIDLKAYLEQNFELVTVLYRRHRRDLGGRLFRNPLQQTNDVMAFAQAFVFLPYPRWRLVAVNRVPPDKVQIPLGGTFGYTAGLDVPAEPPDGGGDTQYRWVLEEWPVRWDLINQNWMCQLVPASVSSLGQILQTPPGPLAGNLRPLPPGAADASVLRTTVAH
ncbi:MAG: prolipoprotein diacylglyceryl transferase [Planctomycetota bacterium]|nr:MAG: prolipoprotein diacylglyceryl transferase [Planctomycetota bacterium]